MLLSPLGERLGEGAMQETVSGLTPSPNLSPKGERNMRARGVGGYAAAVIKPASAEIVAL
jgi:hypothetical protein